MVYRRPEVREIDPSEASPLFRCWDLDRVTILPQSPTTATSAVIRFHLCPEVSAIDLSTSQKTEAHQLDSVALNPGLKFRSSGSGPSAFLG